MSLAISPNFELQQLQPWCFVVIANNIPHFEESNVSSDNTVTERRSVTQGVSRRCVSRLIGKSNGSLNITVGVGRWCSEPLNIVLY